MGDLEKLIRYLERKNYGDFITPFFELIAIIIGLLYVRKEKLRILFLVYLIFDFLIFLCDIYLDAFSSFTKKEIDFFIGLTNNLISLVELLVYFYFFSNILRNRTIIKLMKISAMIFIVIIGLLVTTKYSFLTNRFPYITDLIGTIEFLLLILPCFVFFYELFQDDSAIKLHRRPSFWIVTGIFFYSVMSVPYFMITHFIASNLVNYFSLTYLLLFSIPFTINFIFLTRAFLCKKVLTI